MAKEILTLEEVIFRVKTILEKVRPYIQRDGGDIEFVNYLDGIVYVKMFGACVGCTAIDSTIKDGLEALLLEEVPGVIGVEVVEEEV
ncbi:MAG: NifU family protein [Bacilli bacterium]|nr:NifU family protein [Bacilli bacterium]